MNYLLSIKEIYKHINSNLKTKTVISCFLILVRTVILCSFYNRLSENPSPLCFYSPSFEFNSCGSGGVVLKQIKFRYFFNPNKHVVITELIRFK